MEEHVRILVENAVDPRRLFQYEMEVSVKHDNPSILHFGKSVAKIVFAHKSECLRCHSLEAFRAVVHRS